jgi:hypothetical protein
MKLPRQRLDAIRSVRITERCLEGHFENEKKPRSPSSRDKHWEAYKLACKILAKMKSLENLSIHHHPRMTCWAADYYKPMFQQLFQIQQTRTFELSLFVMRNEYSDSEDEIKRTQDHVERELQDRTFDIILRRCVEGGPGSCGGIYRRTEY